MAQPQPKPTLQEHARQLAAAFHVRLIESDQVLPEEAFAVPHRRLVLCATVRERMTYAIALHELGHVVAPLGNVRALTAGDPAKLSRDEEDAAWAWARHHALEWAPEMEALAQWAEGSYADPTAAAPADPAPAPAPAHIDWSKWK